MPRSPKILDTNPEQTITRRIAEANERGKNDRRVTGLIQTEEVVTAHIFPKAITTEKIEAEAITAEKIKAGAIEAVAIKAGSITTEKLAAEAVTAAKITAGTITATQLAANSVTTAKLAAESVEAGKIKAETITATQIATNAITAVKINAEAVESAKIKAGAITATKIAAEAVEAAAIKALAITTAKLAAESVEAGKIKAETITATQIASSAITTAKIASAAVVASKISVTELSALTGNLGTITAGTVTGATVRTAASGARVQLNSEGLKAFNAAEATIFNFSIATGNLSLKGKVEEGSEVPATTVTGQLTNAQIKEIESAKVSNAGIMTNLIVNPRAVGTTKWSPRATTEMSVDAAEGKAGINAFLVKRKVDGEGNNSIYIQTDPGVASNGANAPDVTAWRGKWVVAAFEARALTSSGKKVNVAVTFSDATNTLIEAPVKGEVVAPLSTETEGTIRVWAAFKVPANAVTGDVRFQCPSGAEGEEFVFSNFAYYGTEVEPLTVAEVLPFWPTTALLAAGKAEWNGTADLSTSRFKVFGLSTAAELLGKLTSAQIESLEAAKITGQIVEAQIAAEAVTAAKLKAEAVEAGKIKTGAVTETKVGPEAITAAKIATNAIEAGKIKAEAIEAGKIATGAVTAVKIAASAITAEKIASEAVEAAKIKAATITATQIAASAITAEKIAASAVTATKIGAEAVEAGAIHAGAITATKIGAEAVEAGAIKAGAISTAKLAAGAVTAEKITAGTITATQLGANSVTGEKIAAETIEAGDIKAGTITATQIAASAITASQLAAEAITVEKIAAGAVTATKLNVTELSAITGSLGEVHLPQATSAKIASSLTWRSGETVTEFISAYGTTGEFRDIVIGTGKELDITSGESALRLQAITEGKGSLAFSQAILQTGKVLTTLMNGLGESNFLQLTSIANSHIISGTATVKFTALEKESETLTVTHGLGKTPSQVVATVASGRSNMTLTISEKTAITFKIRCAIPAVLGVEAKEPIDWIAIG